MKKFFALVLSAILCCSPPVTPLQPRHFDIELHADTEFNDAGRALILRAAENIAQLTHRRANVTVVFDLDFNSISNIKEHEARHHSLVVPVMSDSEIVQRIDGNLKGPGTPLAATITKNDRVLVVLVMDRIQKEKFENVVTHEFGHVIGFPDLPEMGAIMSGRTNELEAPLQGWQPADVKLCERFRYCN